MASKELSSEIREELCLRNIDTFSEVRSFRKASRITKNTIEDMSGVLSGVSSRKNRAYISRKRVRHDSLKLFNEGRLADCVQEPEGGCEVFSGIPITAGLVAQYDAQDLSSLPGGIVDGGSVTFWNDVSGNANNATNTFPAWETGANPDPPIFRSSSINGFNAIEGSFGFGPNSGSALFLGDNVNFEFDNYSVFMVNKMKGVVAGDGAILVLQNARIDPADSGIVFNFAAGLNSSQASGGIQNTKISAIVNVNNESVVSSNVKNGTSSKLFKNGTEVAILVEVGSTPAVIDFTTAVDKYSAIFGGSGANNIAGFDSFIGEIAIYNVPLSDLDRSQVEQYLLCKWGFV